MKYLIILIMLSLTLLMSCGDDSTSVENGTITGIILNAETNTPISNVMVSTNPPTEAVLTSAAGEYSITNISPGNYTLIAEKKNFQGKTVNIKVSSNKTTKVDILLDIDNNNSSKPNKPELISPQDLSVIRVNKVKLVWTCTDPDGDELKYLVYFGKSRTTMEVVGNDIIDTSYSLFDLNQDATYYWQVMAKDEGGLTAVSEIFEFKYAVDSPDKPLLIYPNDHSKVKFNNLSLRWTCTDPNQYSLNYSVYMGNSPTNLNIIAENITDTDYQIFNLVQDMKYYWRVSATNTAGKTSLSNIFEFTHDTNSSFIPNNDDILLNLDFENTLDDIGPSKFQGTPKDLEFTEDRNGSVNSAVYFNGYSSYLKLENSRNLHLSDEYTISFWLNFESTDIGEPIGDAVFIISKYGEGGLNGASYSMGITTEKKLFVSHYNNGSNVFITEKPLSHSIWNHVCITYNGEILKIYINGIETDSEIIPKPLNCNYNLYLGGCYFEINSTFNRTFKGKIDDLIFFEKVLTVEEIKSLSN